MIRVCVRVRVSVGLGSVLLTDMDKCKIMVMHDYGKVIDTVVVRVRATARVNTIQHPNPVKLKPAHKFCAHPLNSIKLT